MKALMIAVLMLLPSTVFAKSPFSWGVAFDDNVKFAADRDVSFNLGNFQCEFNSATTATNGVVVESSRMLTCISKTEVRYTGATCRKVGESTIYLPLNPTTVNGIELKVVCN
jgi:hypothetical protein